MDIKNIVDKVIFFSNGERFGSVSLTARELGVKVQSFGKWRAKNEIPFARCRDCEILTQGRVSLHEMNPMFPPNATWLPQDEEAA